MLGIVQVFQIAIGNIDRQRYTTLALCLLNGSDFAAGITGVKLVKPVLNSGKIVVYPVGVNGVVIVIDGNEADTVLRKGEVGIKSCQRRISPKSGKVLASTYCHPSRFDFSQHGLEAGAVIGHTTHAVVHEKCGIRKMMLLCV